MPDDDWALGQNEVDVRNEARNPLNAMPVRPRPSLPYRLFSDWEEHEGMVTVYDSTGRYMGCMGINAWHDIVAETQRKVAE